MTLNLNAFMELSLKKKVIAVLSTIFAVSQLYLIFTGDLDPFRLRVMHLGFALALVFLLNPTKKDGGTLSNLVDGIFIFLSVFPVFYLFYTYDTLVRRMVYVQKIPTHEYVIAFMCIIALLEATRRIMGFALPILASLALAYAFFGNHISGLFGHKGFRTLEIVDQLFYTTEGIFGVALGASSTFVILFVIFGAFLEQSGISDYFMNLSLMSTAKQRGGPAKMAVIASGLFGSISGSAIANVATTGQVTIPLMKKNGYRSEFAGAVEAVASTGGQIMPPVMGAAVFIMSDFIGIPYINILKHAIFPALLYYAAVYFMVHFEAVKSGIPLADISGLPSKKELLKNAYLLLPLIILVVVLIRGYSPMFSCMFSMLCIIFISMFKKETRMGLAKILAGLINGAKGTLPVAMACATAGIMVGILNYSGVGIKFTSLMLAVAQQNIFLVLLVTALATMILGMGLPTTPAYIIVASLMAPTLVRLEVSIVAAHLFCFYFANVANITPPVALASYTAAGISESDPMKTGFEAFKLGAVAYIVPFMFVYSPSLLLIGDNTTDLVIAVITASIGTLILSGGIQGYLLRKMSIIERIILIAAALLLIHPGSMTDIIGLGITLCIVLMQKFLKSKQ